MFNAHAIPPHYSPEIPETYGAIPAISTAPIPAARPKGRFSIPGQRRRINFVPIIVCIFIPSVLFCITYWIESFSVHFNDPGLSQLVAGLCFMVVVSSAIAAAGTFGAKAGEAREPSWYIFLFVSNLFAWLAGMVFGNMNFVMHMQPYYDIQNLNTYTGVDPSVLRGQMVMDAGRIVFTPNSRLDLKKSVGFKNQDTFCVAPVSLGNSTSELQELSSYDFWAVGINCCSSEGGDFHCGGSFKSPSAHAGLRLMRNDQRPFFRLAVQQAEAAHGIKAMHPLFFEWMPDPVGAVNQYADIGFRNLIIGCCSCVLLQAFLVASAVMFFSKIGQS